MKLFRSDWAVILAFVAVAIGLIILTTPREDWWLPLIVIVSALFWARPLVFQVGRLKPGHRLFFWMAAGAVVFVLMGVFDLYNKWWAGSTIGWLIIFISYWTVDLPARK